MKYHLEKYNSTKKTRHRCPQCGGKKEFARYVVAGTGAYLADHVGKCNREDNCGYHYRPSDFFRDGGRRPDIPDLKTEVPPEIDYLPYEYVKKSMHLWEQENLSNYLTRKFGWFQVLAAYKKYRVGTIKRWGGRAIVFWQIDMQNRVHFGKVMGYDQQGHRIKNRVHSVHSILSKMGKVRKDYNTKMCFFGEHLLQSYENPVNMVESEKTALFCHLKFGGLWLATSQMHGLNMSRCRALTGRDVILWPDLGRGVQEWQKKKWIVEKFAKSVRIETVYKYLDLKPRSGQGQWRGMVVKWWNRNVDGLDLMDFYLE